MMVDSKCYCTYCCLFVIKFCHENSSFCPPQFPVISSQCGFSSPGLLPSYCSLMLLDSPPVWEEIFIPPGCFVLFLFLFSPSGATFSMGLFSVGLPDGLPSSKLWIQLLGFSLPWCFEPGQIPATGENHQKGEEGWNRRVGHQPTVFSFHKGQQGLCSQKRTSKRVLSIFEGNLSDAFSHVFSQNVEGCS